MGVARGGKGFTRLMKGLREGMKRGALDSTSLPIFPSFPEPWNPKTYVEHISYKDQTCFMSVLGFTSHPSESFLLVLLFFWVFILLPAP